ncbi:MAG TPA: hypothetical protein ENJ82_10470 [Bacteroidetes bacterium]|nr:hypothetical protein [Bacteroidota bacterium]
MERKIRPHRAKGKREEKTEDFGGGYAYPEGSEGYARDRRREAIEEQLREQQLAGGLKQGEKAQLPESFNLAAWMSKMGQDTNIYDFSFATLAEIRAVYPDSQYTLDNLTNAQWKTHVQLRKVAGNGPPKKIFVIPNSAALTHFLVEPPEAELVEEPEVVKEEAKPDPKPKPEKPKSVSKTVLPLKERKEERIKPIPDWGKKLDINIKFQSYSTEFSPGQKPNPYAKMGELYALFQKLKPDHVKVEDIYFLVIGNTPHGPEDDIPGIDEKRQAADGSKLSGEALMLARANEIRARMIGLGIRSNRVFAISGLGKSNISGSIYAGTGKRIKRLFPKKAKELGIK